MNPRNALRRLAAPLIIVVGQAVVFFIALGGLDHLRAWLVFGLMALHGLIGLPLVRRYNPGLLAERWKERADTAPYERAVGVGLFVVRASLEDRLLHRGLAGYAEYARRTRRRLIPGVW